MWYDYLSRASGDGMGIMEAVGGQEAARLDELSILLSKMGHSPRPYLRMEARRLDAFRCAACGYVRRLTSEPQDEDQIAPCMSGAGE